MGGNGSVRHSDTIERFARQTGATSEKAPSLDSSGNEHGFDLVLAQAFPWVRQ